MRRLVDAVRWSGWDIIAAGALIASFVAVTVWFDVVDQYHRHFFDAGSIVLANNVARIVFALLLAWLVYAPGAGVLALLAPPGEPAKSTPPERAVLCFGIGIGLWHVAMLILGILSLYYRSIAVGVAFIVVLASARHFAVVARGAARVLASRLKELRHGTDAWHAIGVSLGVAAAVWVLLVRGLYPGGGGDYYTHYFPYYIEVLRNHGLAPNDVWYHYYYSKGCGLFFLGMLLTDPEAPEVVTFCCVVFAAIAMATLTTRLAPRSLWPLLAVLLYLLFNLVELSDILGSGGEFQKDHEMTTALVVLTIWGICMARGAGARAYLAMATSSATAAAIITQPIGIILTFYFAMLGGVAMLRRQWSRFCDWLLLGSVTGGVVFAVFLLGYLQTGLATDQPLGLMLRFADIARLDHWGVLPQLVIVAWIRDNYAEVAPPFGWGVIGLLREFTRLDFLWVFLIGPAVALLTLAAMRRLAATKMVGPSANSFPRLSLTYVAALLGLLVVISAATGRVQNISFERFSSFFVPLIVLLGVAMVGWVLTRLHGGRWRWLLSWPLPIALLVATLALWNNESDWDARVSRVTTNAIRYFDGTYSLAAAYGHQDLGYAFGGINPEALTAWRQVPAGAPIWSTNSAAYCMVPGCWIESSVSFKMSGQLDEILAGPPERAKQLLQQAGLNYFLFIDDLRMLDMLPYSKLFAPDTIGKFLGIKWTDGNAYLLTWFGTDTRPIDQHFLELYQHHLATDDLDWFQFQLMVSRIARWVAQLRSSRWGHAVNFDFAEAKSPPGGINVIDATYGRNCRTYRVPWPDLNTFREGNATVLLHRLCVGKLACSFTVSLPPLADVARGCDKDFWVQYKCPDTNTVRAAGLPGNAYGKTLKLDCGASP